jgi:coenzyme F420-reducing hydrogenase delta subunit
MTEYKVTFLGSGATRRIHRNGTYYWQGRPVIVDDETARQFMDKSSFKVEEVSKEPVEKIKSIVTEVTEKTIETVKKKPKRFKKSAKRSRKD